MRPRMIMIAGTVALTLAAGPLLPASGAAASLVLPASLAGETLSGAPTLTNVTCNFVGNSSQGTFDFSVSGTATGPYPGTFTETGSGTVSAVGGQLAFSASFTITSPAGNVTGTKSLASSGLFAAGCDPGLGNIVANGISANYQATISIQGVAYTDSGTSTTVVVYIPGYAQDFSDIFDASNGVVPPEPTSKTQCMDGGWQAYPQFNNQGDCISYVENGR